uniref:Uncharacterized protein n=1 Tax=Ralstonia solanacearum TaxID=305 RepID=A0A0S4WJM1_RALSL|nr:protein of unknown function [Ralstonia solanacearum]CUV32864.1 protein of unknown function [Ralstonia solanacearum]CUV38989.1 protein of unknown function [Ralstonia solanacearum]CUV46871.1 protein of unknown function [Ralstonia solanacearum]CUV54317.1 protein of unknown function [Ralstonia solanacearum]
MSIHSRWFRLAAVAVGPFGV